MTVLWCFLVFFALGAAWAVRGHIIRERLVKLFVDGRELTGLQLRNDHGFSADVYVYLRDLVKNGSLVVREEPGTPERGGMPRYYYRRKALWP